MLVPLVLRSLAVSRHYHDVPISRATIWAGRQWLSPLFSRYAHMAALMLPGSTSPTSGSQLCFRLGCCDGAGALFRFSQGSPMVLVFRLAGLGTALLMSARPHLATFFT